MVTSGHDQALRVFQSAPGQPLTAAAVADAMIKYGHDFGAAGRTQVARAALVTAILNRLASTHHGQLAVASPLGNEARWYLPVDTPPPQGAPTLASTTPASATAQQEAALPPSRALEAWFSLLPDRRYPTTRDRALTAIATILLVVAAALVVIAVT